MKNLVGLIVVLALGFSVGGIPVGTAQGEDAKVEVAKFAGTWTMLDRNDKKPENRKWIFTGDKITDKNRDDSREGTFRIDPAKKHLDFLVEGKVKFVGIYEFTDGGKKLKFCGTEVPPDKDKEAVRPTELKRQKGWILYLLERAK